MNWFFSLPITFLATIVLLYYLGKKNITFQKLKSTFPFLFILLFLSLALSVLKLDAVAGFFNPDGVVNILLLLLLFFTLIFSVKFISFLLFDFLFSQKQAIRFPSLIKDIVVIVLYSIGLLSIAKYYLNIQITVVLASSAVITVIIGFALQDVLGDLFFGIALNLEEALKVGDWVKIGDYEGQIEQFRWRSIKIRTIDNVLVLIPNQIASRQAVNSFGHEGKYFSLRTVIGVSYKNSPDHVIGTLQEVLRSIDQILETPRSQVWPRSFDDFSISYELKFYVRDYAVRNAVIGEINRKTWYAFKRNDIEIPFPIRDIYIKKAVNNGPTRDVVVETLKKNDLLDTIDNAQLQDLVEVVEIQTYGSGEMVITEGQEGHYFYHILSGEVEVLKKGRVVGRLSNNDYFGEFSLFTGEKTSADVRAITETGILRLCSEKFRETVRINKPMARKLSEVIARRRESLNQFNHKAVDPGFQPGNDTENIFLRIKKYFSL